VAVGRFAVREGGEDVHFPLAARALGFLVIVNVADELRDALPIAEAPVERERDRRARRRIGKIPEDGRQHGVRRLPSPDVHDWVNVGLKAAAIVRAGRTA
jgi:hypothetical protein